MQMQWIKLFVLGGVAWWTVLLLGACAPKEEQGLTVWSTVLPQQYFVQRIGGGLVTSEVLVRPGQSPEMYAPSAAQVARLARADVYFGIGMPIEGPLFERIASTMLGVRIVHAGGEIVEGRVHQDHSACSVYGHHHGEVDPHIWMDPVQMVDLVGHVRDALVELSPEAAATFQVNADALIVELKELDEQIRAQLAPYRGRGFFINHPALGHFAQRYGLVQWSIEESGSAPSAGRIANLIGQAREAKVGAIFTQPEFGRTTAQILADALAVEVVELNVLPVDYISGLSAIADALEGSFGDE
jgi:zinc transport system substrate-binding protein